MKLKLIDFIKENSDWEALLSQAPYCLNISRDQKFGRNLIMFKYSQQNSDFSNDIVKECRGIIFDEDTFEPISVPYFKFFNVGEPNAAEVDWSTAEVQEKIDGSIMKAVKLSDHELLISTNGCIDAFKCELNSQIGCPYNNFGELFIAAVYNQMEALGLSPKYNDPIEWLAGKLEVGMTYMFELCSRYNRIVVPHEEPKLYFHGLRDNKSLLEFHNDDNYPSLSLWFDIPKRFSMKTLDDCLAATQAMPWNEEGYVVVDNDFNRVKIKSGAYLMVHKMANNGSMSIRRAIDVYMAGECDEILAYFPEYKSAFDEIACRHEDKINELDIEMLMLFAKIDDGTLPTRKDQAQWILSRTKHSGILFKVLNEYDGKADPNAIRNALAELYARHADAFVRLLGY